MNITSVMIVGSGPAGIGLASLLNQSDVDYTVLEKNEIGSSFTEWPENMEMITPSFPSNAFGQIDLNSICVATSPAFSFNKEHLTGKEYSDYLKLVADYFDIHVQTRTEVIKVHKQKKGWQVETNRGLYFTKYLIWAAGEFNNPQINNIEGSQYCIHSSKIREPKKLAGDNFVVVGGYESGIQLAFDLIKNNKTVTLINPTQINDLETSDPSRVVSPYTFIKYSFLKDSPLYTEILDEVKHIYKSNDLYQLQLKEGNTITSNSRPISATGFALVKDPIEEFIIEREDGNPKLNEKTDEFYGQKNLYLTGPSVRHDNHIFCFIYKFRQRFGVIVEDILKKENYKDEAIELLVNTWKQNGMYLSDLSCCDEECIC